MNEQLHPSFKVLIVDDEPAWTRTMEVTLAVSGGIDNTLSCHDSRQVLDIIEKENVGLVLLDLNMPHIPGETLLEQIKEQHPDVAVIVISGMNQVDAAVSCMYAGAFTYFVKTVDEKRLIKGVQNAIVMLELQREHLEISLRFLSGRLDHPEHFSEIITNDKAMLSIFQYVEAVARGRRPVLITGESGVGKELIAQAFHKATGNTGELVSVNAAGLDDAVFSDTLFGHVKGGVYRGGRFPQRIDRPRQRRNPVSGRDRRPEPFLPGETAAPTAGGRILPGRQRQAAPDHRPDHRRNQPGSQGKAAVRRISKRPVLPAALASHRGCRPCANARATCRCCWIIFSRKRQRNSASRSRPSPSNC